MIAVVRAVSARFDECELTFVDRGPIDVARARVQHEAYVSALERLGASPVWLPPQDELPDAVFVEDTAVIVGKFAVIARPGSPRRQPETETVVPALAALREVVRIQAPATLEGGDVLRIGDTFYVGISTRTNEEGFAQLARIAARAGFRAEPVPVRGCLHLKTGCTYLGDGRLLINPAWIDPAGFRSVAPVAVDPGEPWAANTLRLGRTLLASAASPRTAAALRALGFDVVELDISELAKAEAGLTCMSIIVAA